ncbi:hypothetical protein [Dyadobacter tibetensis]|uniref:hypothetical protein n=1 Tax=Dyadobacter tibetensis TaxID=1211851 RepID=UPI0004712026|nr:hypothetical protein [Dyadobacter tibetensis]
MELKTPVLFLAISLLAIVLFYLASGRKRWVLTGSFIWLTVIGLLAYFRVFIDTSIPPRILIVILTAFILGIFTYRKLELSTMSLPFLMAIHGLRLPVEIVLLQLYHQGLVPEVMTFQGWNFDIFIGITGLLWLLFHGRINILNHPMLLLIWNVLGFCMLTIIVLLAILTSPLPFQVLAFDQPNRAVLQFPYTFLPAFIVPLVYLAHILEINRLTKYFLANTFLEKKSLFGGVTSSKLNITDNSSFE